MHTAERYHDFSAGHRVAGHEGHCRHIHGHNYRVHFTCEAAPNCNQLDEVGRVIDFSVIKQRLCMWLEENWDHKFLAWEDDMLMRRICDVTLINAPAPGHYTSDAGDMLVNSIVWTTFNPTAENMAEYLVRQIGPQQLEGTGVVLVSCRIEETRKCSATYTAEELL